ncbi:hypothetical protein DID88_005905 [Monilinia fructigena]|uniref:BZIP domain-containing protein n=1 Tax=Monilinia fructigena TaxID=38457 RepID=A0A395J2B4_9HELO|nr:hypothetical protein DID88_005905 [Monilinia fructigena]
MAAFQCTTTNRQSSLSVDTQPHNYFEEDEGSILDDNILDHSALDSGLEMSPPMDNSRRESFAVSSTLFSPRLMTGNTSTCNQWLPTIPLSSTTATTHSCASRAAQNSTYGHSNHGWGMGNGSGMSTPMQGHDGLPSEFEVNVPIFQRPGRWYPKKNARFDIPAERNLTNIDQLISQSTDEQEIKELKQQKLLIAQRKKQHTERLEDEKKHYTALINDLEEDLGEAKLAWMMAPSQRSRCPRSPLDVALVGAFVASKGISSILDVDDVRAASANLLRMYSKMRHSTIRFWRIVVSDANKRNCTSSIWKLLSTTKPHGGNEMSRTSSTLGDLAKSFAPTKNKTMNNFFIVRSTYRLNFSRFLDNLPLQGQTSQGQRTLVKHLLP